MTDQDQRTDAVQVTSEELTEFMCQFADGFDIPPYRFAEAAHALLARYGASPTANHYGAIMIDQDREAFSQWFAERNGLPNDADLISYDQAFETRKAWQAALEWERSRAADMFWDDENADECLCAGSLDEAVDLMVNNAGLPHFFPVEFTFQCAKQFPTIKVTVIGVDDNGKPRYTMEKDL